MQAIEQRGVRRIRWDEEGRKDGREKSERGETLGEVKRREKRRGAHARSCEGTVVREMEGGRGKEGGSERAREEGSEGGREGGSER